MSGIVKDKNQDPDKVIRSYFNFRVKSPFNHFCEIFKKQIEHQWPIGKAHLLSLVLQVLNLGCLLITQKFITIRMELEENEFRRVQWALMIHVVSWVFLCQLRRKNFSIPKFLGWMTFNLFALTFLYLNSYMLAANTLGDPNSKIIYASLVVSDCFFTYLYVVLNDYLHPSGYLGFSMFPKIFLAICFYFYFDDRFYEVLGVFALTSAQTAITGIHAEELMADVHREEVQVDEFHVLDYYSLTYLDLPYIAKMCYYAFADILIDLKQRVFKQGKEKKE